MLTIGAPALFSFVAYLAIVGLIWRSIAFALSRRNEGSAIARAMHFIY